MLSNMALLLFMSWIFTHVSGARLVSKGTAVSFSNLNPSTKYYPIGSGQYGHTIDCLPADSMVTMDTMVDDIGMSAQTYKRMDELVEGDTTQIGGKVFMFTHRDPHRTALFVRMETFQQNSHGVSVLEVTSGHYVYTNDGLIAARDVRVGDWLRKSSGDAGKVVSISHVLKRGVYNPQTMRGDISVNGFLVSTYTEAIHPNAAHSLLAPLRMIYNTLNRYTKVLYGGIEGKSTPQNV